MKGSLAARELISGPVLEDALVKLARSVRGWESSRRGLLAIWFASVFRQQLSKLKSAYDKCLMLESSRDALQLLY